MIHSFTLFTTLFTMNKVSQINTFTFYSKSLIKKIEKKCIYIMTAKSAFKLES